MADTPNDDTAQALKRLERDGSDLSKPMEMDFFIAVPSREVGNKVAQRVQKLGYTTSVEQDTETLEWTCYCTKVIVPEYFEVVLIEQQLDSIAKELGGYADGFGSYGNTG